MNSTPFYLARSAIRACPPTSTPRIFCWACASSSILYVNARPVELLHDRLTPLHGRTEKDIRLMVIRENTEGLYVGVGGFFKKGTADEIAVQEDVNSRKGVERIIRYAFEYAKQRA